MELSWSERQLVISEPDGVGIPGILCVPNGAERARVLMLHGITTSKNEYLDFFRELAHTLAGCGVGSLRIDFRGHGDSQVSSRAFTVASQCSDTYAALKWYLDLEPHSDVTYHVLGCSFGAPRL